MKILVLCLPGIGDALMATPMISVLKKELPNATIDIACMFQGVEYIFKNNPYIDNIHFLNIYHHNKFLSVLRVLPLRNQRYDASILAFPAYRKEYHVVQWLVGARKRVTHRFNHGYWSELNFLDTGFIPVDEKEHHVINNLNLLKIFGIDWKKKYKKTQLSYEFALNKLDIEYGKKYIQDLGWNNKEVIGFHPGSINSKVGTLKRWPIENFALLAKELIAKKKKIIIFIGPDETELGEKLYRIIDNARDCKLINNLKFNQSVGILHRVSLLITNDNGFAHLANALKIKTIVLFGPTNIAWCAPYDKSTSTVIRKATFEPWFRNDMKVTHPPKNARSGMEQIEVHDVLKAYDNIR